MPDRAAATSPAGASRRPARRPRRPPAGALLLAALVAALPAGALADGLNEWTGTPAEPGTFWFLPEAIVGVAGGPRTLYLQMQYGVTDGVDLVAYPIVSLGGGGPAEPVLEAFVRRRVAEDLLLGLGFNLPLYLRRDPSLVLGAFHTFWPVKGVWKVSWNVLAWLPPDLDQSALMGIAVLNRALGGSWTVFAELDATASRTAGPNVNFLPGVQYAVSAIDTINLSVILPLRPALQRSSLGVGIWVGHGFGVKPAGAVAARQRGG